MFQALDDRVRALVSLIFDKEMMKSQLKAMDIDVKKMPVWNKLHNITYSSS